MKLFCIQKSNDYDNLCVEGNIFEVDNIINVLRKFTLTRNLAYLVYSEKMKILSMLKIKNTYLRKS